MYIEDMYPGLILYRQAKEFLESLSRMRYCDWVIHKRLGEYRYLRFLHLEFARGGGKSPFYYWSTDEESDS